MSNIANKLKQVYASKPTQQRAGEMIFIMFIYYDPFKTELKMSIS